MSMEEASIAQDGKTLHLPSIARQFASLAEAARQQNHSHLRYLEALLQAFYGVSENAVKTQIRIAVSVYGLVAIVRKRLGIKASLYQTSTDFPHDSVRERPPISRALPQDDSQNNLSLDLNQLNLFDS